MKTIKLKLLEPIDGYEDEVELRLPKEGEMYIRPNGKVSEAAFSFTNEPYIVLTPKETPASKLGLEVGVVYVLEDRRNACTVTVEPDGSLSEQNSLNGGHNAICSSELSFYRRHGLRKVINSDGSMVDGDIEWVTVGGKEVTKADLREACKSTQLSQCDFGKLEAYLLGRWCCDS